MEFVQTLDDSGHVILFNENELHASRVIAKFLEIGVRKGNRCILASTGGPMTVRSQLSMNGVNVSHEMKNGRLNLVNLATLDTKKGTEQRERLVDESLILDSDLRIVFHQPAPSNENSIRKHTELETKVHSRFESEDNPPNGARKRLILCSFSIRGIKPIIHYNWMIDILKHHNSAIFIPSLSGGVGFRMR